MNLIARFSPRRFVVMAAVALIAGCAVGPNFHRPPAPKVRRYTPEPLSPKTTSAKVAGGEPQRFVQGLDIPGQWWKLFHSKPLSALIEQSLKANPDLQAAQSALRVAKENVLAQKGAFYPSISASFTPTRNKTATESLSPASASGNPYYSLYTTQVIVSYTPDVFGLNRRTVESLEAQTDAQRFQLEATYLTLTSNLVAAAVQEASLRGQIAATGEVIRIDKDELEVMRRQNELGQIAMADVVAQEAALAQAQETLPPLQKQLAQQRNLLTALVGSPPSEQPAQRFELGSLRLPQDLPVSLPAKLIEERPDVRSAEANLHAASAQIGVAVANRLPNLTLSANGGSAAAQIARLFSTGTGYWTLAATVAAPIFEGRHLAAQATRRPGHLRPGGGTISQHRPYRAP
jgi:NodT family efflux transporter outer membrane factor (OMF) lipoprotein